MFVAAVGSELEAANAESFLLSGVGVAVRLVDHGLIESTAELRYDFSGFLSSVPEGILADEAPDDSRATACTILFAPERTVGDGRCWYLTYKKHPAPARSASVMTFVALVRAEVRQVKCIVGSDNGGGEGEGRHIQRWSEVKPF